MTTNVQVSDLPETTTIAPIDYLHVKKTDGVDYKIKQAAAAVIGIRDSSINLTTSNPTLLAGQWSKESDTGLIKCGDGVTSYNNLSPVAKGLTIDTTVKTTTFSAKLNTLYYLDTTSGSFNINLPIPIDKNDTIVFIDYSSSWETSNPILNYSTNKIEGLAENMALDISCSRVELRYINSAKGWKVTV